MIRARVAENHRHPLRFWPQRAYLRSVYKLRVINNDFRLIKRGVVTTLSVEIIALTWWKKKDMPKNTRKYPKIPLNFHRQDFVWKSGRRRTITKPRCDIFRFLIWQRQIVCANRINLEFLKCASWKIDGKLASLYQKNLPKWAKIGCILLEINFFWRDL